MDTKKEALEKAKELCVKKAIEHIDVNIAHSDGGSWEVNWYDLNRQTRLAKQFPYAPPREAPAKGTIVEVWDNDAKEARLKYSTGAMQGNRLEVNPRADTKYPEDNSAWTNWRTVDCNINMVYTSKGYGCRWSPTCVSDASKCKECKTTIPTNFEAE
jgi:hypothetical protein